MEKICKVSTIWTGLIFRHSKCFSGRYRPQETLKWHWVLNLYTDKSEAQIAYIICLTIDCPSQLKCSYEELEAFWRNLISFSGNSTHYRKCFLVLARKSIFYNLSHDPQFCFVAPEQAWPNVVMTTCLLSEGTDRVPLNLLFPRSKAGTFFSHTWWPCFLSPPCPVFPWTRFRVRLLVRVCCSGMNIVLHWLVERC